MYNPKTAQCSFKHHYDDDNVLYKQVVVYSWKMLQYLSTWRWGEQEGPLLVGESVAEVAPVAVGTGVAGQDHPAKLGLVAWVPDDRTQLSDAVSELAVVTVWTRAGLLPLVAQLCLHHPLIVYLQLHCLFILLSLSCHVHPLLLLLLLLLHTHINYQKYN